MPVNDVLCRVRFEREPEIEESVPGNAKVAVLCLGLAARFRIPLRWAKLGNTMRTFKEAFLLGLKPLGLFSLGNLYDHG